VVLVLSKEFTNSPYHTTALHLLLERHKQGCTAMLVPLPCNISWEELQELASPEHMAGAGYDIDQQQTQQQDLKQLQAFASNEVSTLQTQNLSMLTRLT
jgi:hypothetical protein